MAENLLFSIAQQLLPTLASFASQEIGLVYGVKSDLRRLQEMFSIVKDFLLDAEEKQGQSHAVKSWIGRLKEVVYDADDLFEDIATENLRRKVEGGAKMTRKVCDFFSSSNQLALRLKMGHRIKDVRERLDELKKDVPFIGIIRKEVGGDSPTNCSKRQTDSSILEPETIGREEDKKKIIELLLSLGNEKRVSAVAIVGFGGLGKTAVAQLVYNDESVAKYFDMKIWICVSEESNVEVLAKKILNEIAPSNEVRDLSLEQSKIRLRQNIEGKKYLLVLDDVWKIDHQIWSQLKKYLMVGAIGSKILVTTRSMKIASGMGVESSYALRSLTENQSWELFEKLVFGEAKSEVNSSIVKIGREIAKKCKGVPLVIKALGSMLRERINESEWLSVLENEMWRLFESGDNDIFPALKLSYDHLPIYLRQCFVYCSVFPKDYEFCREELITLWMAQGYIQFSAKSESENLEEIAHQCFDELLFRSFFQKSEDDEDMYKMHDLIHDLAQSIGGGSCSVVNDDVKDIPVGVRHVYCEESLLLPPTLILKEKGLRTLLVENVTDYGLVENVSDYGSDKYFHTVASNCTRLRALRLRNLSLAKLGNSIGKFKHLRFLDISGNDEIASLPNSICSLCNLQTLVLSHCSKLRELPRDLRKLISLRHFMINGCETLAYMPVGLGKLTALRTLSNFKVAAIRDDRRKSNNSALLNELNSLNQLRGEMTIEGLGNVNNAALESSQVNLKEKKYLHTLSLEWDGTRNSESGTSELLLDNLHPHPNLKALRVNSLQPASYEGVRFSNWLSSLTNIVEIKISNCPKCKHLPSLDQLPCLEVLCLAEFEALEYISSAPFSSYAPFFPSLKDLTIYSCDNLKGWWSKYVELPVLPQFPCLSKLKILYCTNLALMPTFPSLNAKLELWGASIRPLHETMKMMTLSATSTSSSSPSVTAPLSTLKRMNLYNLVDLDYFLASKDGTDSTKGGEDQGMMLWRCFRSLENLCLWHLPKMLSLPSGLQYATSLQHLKILFCLDLSTLPDWIPNLTSLESLTIDECPKLTSLPKAMQQLTSLKTLVIERCPYLPERCGNDMAADWPNIAHIPNIRIDGRDIQREGQYLLEEENSSDSTDGRMLQNHVGDVYYCDDSGTINLGQKKLQHQMLVG